MPSSAAGTPALSGAVVGTVSESTYSGRSHSGDGGESAFQQAAAHPHQLVERNETTPPRYHHRASHSLSHHQHHPHHSHQQQQRRGLVAGPSRVNLAPAPSAVARAAEPSNFNVLEGAAESSGRSLPLPSVAPSLPPHSLHPPHPLHPLHPLLPCTSCAHFTRPLQVRRDTGFTVGSRDVDSPCGSPLSYPSMLPYSPPHTTTPAPICPRYDDKGFTVGGRDLDSSILCVGDLALCWSPSCLADVTPDSLALFQLIRPQPGIDSNISSLLLSCPLLFSPLPPLLSSPLLSSSHRFSCFPLPFPLFFPLSDSFSICLHPSSPIPSSPLFLPPPPIPRPPFSLCRAAATGHGAAHAGSTWGVEGVCEGVWHEARSALNCECLCYWLERTALLLSPLSTTPIKAQNNFVS
ncbi:unnamed protein product [Closterium sp. NIES-53]